jgi:TetR/AcrR family transcriptional regulator, regulator of autoinduction and epiphytic fitness
MLEYETYASRSDTSTFYSEFSSMSTQRDDRVDPRIERSRMVILEAAVDELAEVGYGGVTIESVAARAGVGKSTIYRHWPDKLALIADAFETFHVQMVPDLAERSARESVELLVRHVAEVVVDSTFSRCIPALIEGAERDPRVRDFHHLYSAERRQVLVDLIARGVEDREFRPGLDPELATAALLGVIFYRRLMTGEPFDPATAGELVDLVLGPEPPPRPRR